MPAILKILLSAALIWLVNEVVVKHSKPLLGSLIASLPLVSLLTFVWIHHDLRDRPQVAVERLAAHSTGLFWFVLPTLPMFLVFPAGSSADLAYGQAWVSSASEPRHSMPSLPNFFINKPARNIGSRPARRVL
jgi:hypothetical protein